MKHLRTYATCAVVFLALDAIWLTFAGSRLYRPAIGHLMQPGFDSIAAAAFYVVYIAGVLAFVLVPSTHARDAALRGAGFGFVAYATYDLTNQATLAGWPWHVTIADLVWGTFATAVASAVAFAVANRSRR